MIATIQDKFTGVTSALKSTANATIFITIGWGLLGAFNDTIHADVTPYPDGVRVDYVGKGIVVLDTNKTPNVVRVGNDFIKSIDAGKCYSITLDRFEHLQFSNDIPSAISVEEKPEGCTPS